MDYRQQWGVVEQVVQYSGQTTSAKVDRVAKYHSAPSASFDETAALNIRPCSIEVAEIDTPMKGEGVCHTVRPNNPAKRGLKMHELLSLGVAWSMMMGYGERAEFRWF